jgi:hypothetical protein
VSWDILEQNEGGIVQLIIAGKPDVTISAQATVEGQGAIREVAFVPRVNRPVLIPAAAFFFVLACLRAVFVGTTRPRALRRKAT